MFFLPARLAPGDASADPKAQIQALMQAIKQNPQDQKPLLQLAQLYARIWGRTQQADIPPRIIQVLQRAVALEQGAHAGKIMAFVAQLSAHAQSKEQAEFVDQLAALQQTLQEKMAPAPEPPVAEPEAPADAPAPEPPGSPAGEADEEETSPDAESDIEIVEEGDDSGEEVLMPGEAPPEPHEEDFEVVSVETDPLESMADPETQPEESTATSSSSAEAMREAKRLFDAEDIQGLIHHYVDLPMGGTKIKIVEQMIKRLDDWGIGPVLAVAAVESDEKMLRQIIRLLRKGNRVAICEHIEMSEYSPDLQRVAVSFLTEMGVKEAVPKLREAADMDDPMVRSVALGGLARTGAAAKRFLPFLVQKVGEDPCGPVRRATAQALKNMHSKEALEALEAGAQQYDFDAAVYDILNAMRDEFSEGGSKKSAGRLGGTDKGPGFLKQNSMQIFWGLLVVAALIGVVVFYVIPQIKKYFP